MWWVPGSQDAQSGAFRTAHLSTIVERPRKDKGSLINQEYSPKRLGMRAAMWASQAIPPSSRKETRSREADGARKDHAGTLILSKSSLRPSPSR